MSRADPMFLLPSFFPWRRRNIFTATLRVVDWNIYILWKLVNRNFRKERVNEVGYLLHLWVLTPTKFNYPKPDPIFDGDAQKSFWPIRRRQAPPFRAVCKAPLRVNPEQAPAFMLGSRRVDWMATQFSCSLQKKESLKNKSGPKFKLFNFILLNVIYFTNKFLVFNLTDYLRRNIKQ